MTNLVETFIEDVRMAEQLSGSNRPLAIRQKITEYEDIIVRNGAGRGASASFFFARRSSLEASRSIHAVSRMNFSSSLHP
jgi:hypothetical protein